MVFLKIVFWLSIFIIFYSYLGYGILIWVYLKLKSTFTKSSRIYNSDQYEPSVTLIVAAYNEEDFIRKKINGLK